MMRRRSCRVVPATWSAWLSISSSRGRKPQVTPQDSTQARRAVSMSTPESPTYNTSAFDVGDFVRISKTIDGSGLTGIPSFCPSMAAQGMPGKKWLTSRSTALWYLFEATASLTPRWARSCSSSGMPGYGSVKSVRWLS